jgi:Rne/Rng family ribonuclease
VAILEDDRLVELLVDRPDTRRSVGDIYLGRVEAVLPGIQAAFVDIGSEKSAFLHASDLVEAEENRPATRAMRPSRALPKPSFPAARVLTRGSGRAAADVHRRETGANPGSARSARAASSPTSPRSSRRGRSSSSR